MHFKSGDSCVWLTFLYATASNAQKTCASGVSISAIDPFIVSKGFTARVIASGLTTPRGIAFDKQGNLLVVEKTKGITALEIKEEGNCITGVTKKTVTTDPTVGNTMRDAG
jgi:6-phosphogluconolactonase (cycloisomerase 2 family)